METLKIVIPCTRYKIETSDKHFIELGGITIDELAVAIGQIEPEECVEALLEKCVHTVDEESDETIVYRNIEELSVSEMLNIIDNTFTDLERVNQLLLADNAKLNERLAAYRSQFGDCTYVADYATKTVGEQNASE